MQGPCHSAFRPNPEEKKLGDEGSSNSFLKRKVLRTEKGLALTPGTSAEKVVKSHEDYFGKIRAQMVPCDQSMQTEDLTDVLSPKDAFAYRSVVGVYLYLARDRPDLLFPVKELSGYMSKPTNGALQKLKKTDGLPQKHIRLLRSSGNV